VHPDPFGACRLEFASVSTVYRETAKDRRLYSEWRNARQ
jgi:hypothetical protein